MQITDGTPFVRYDGSYRAVPPIMEVIMGNAGKTGRLQWAELWPWCHQLEEHGVRVRVVVGFEPPGKIRVSVTLALLTTDGRWKEAHRDGEVISDRSEGGVERAALRAMARLLLYLDNRLDDVPQADYAQLPLPLPPNT
jgi:hypothetical protein